MLGRTFDLITSSVGLLLAALLIVAGALLIWAYTFTNNQVTSQLTEQQITFPAANSPAIKALPPGAFIFLVLSILGFLHMRRTPAEAALPPRVHV